MYSIIFVIIILQKSTTTVVSLLKCYIDWKASVSTVDHRVCTCWNVVLCLVLYNLFHLLEWSPRSFVFLQGWPNLLRWCSPPRQTINTTTAPFIKTWSVQSNLLALIYLISVIRALLYFTFLLWKHHHLFPQCELPLWLVLPSPQRVHQFARWNSCDEWD